MTDPPTAAPAGRGCGTLAGGGDSDTMPEPPERGRGRPGWMRAIWWKNCEACGARISEGQWQARAYVAGHGTRWVHKPCALRLGPLADPAAPADDDPDPALRAGSPPPAGRPGPLRILVVGSPAWPYDRAVEVRDAIDALARGHSRVVILHGTATDQHTGRLIGTDAWAELTATRRGYTAQRHEAATDGTWSLPRPGPDVVIAFPLSGDATTPQRVGIAGNAGIPVLTHTAPEPDT